MQQPSVANYFRIKKRIREDAPSTKSSKLVAISTVSDVAGGLDKPNPIRVDALLSNPTPPEPMIVSSSSDTDIDRKTAKGKRRVACYQKYHHLISTSTQEAQDVDNAPDSTNESSISSGVIKASTSYLTTVNLPLPYKYKLLLEHFRAVDTVASLLLNRNETVTFNKVKPGVLELVRSTQLREKHLAQFLTVFPGCYKFSYEKMSIPGSKESSYQLVMTPNLTLSSTPAYGRMTASQITERENIFANALRDRCHKHHKEFLLSLNPPIRLPVDSQVTRWHPKFPINDVPSIELGVMPKCPDTLSTATAKEVIARARDIMDAANPRMRVALQELMKKTAGATLAQGSPPAEGPLTTSKSTMDPSEKKAATKDAILKAQQALLRRAQGNPAAVAALNNVLVKNNKQPISGSTAATGSGQTGSTLRTTVVDEKRNLLTPKTLSALKGVSQSLIDKIRAREQEKAIRSMTLSPQEAKNQAMLGRLPDFVKIINNTMVAEKKSVLALPLVVERLSHSHYQSLSFSEVEGHLHLLHETVPDWLTILKTSQGDFIKIMKEMNINEIVDKLHGLMRK